MITHPFAIFLLMINVSHGILDLDILMLDQILRGTGKIKDASRKYLRVKAISPR